jgi:hypothetical protein
MPTTIVVDCFVDISEVEESNDDGVDVFPTLH